MANTARIKSNTEENREDLAEQIEMLKRDFHELSNSITKLAGGQVEAAKDEALQKTRQAEDMIRANPLAAAAIALGLGFLFGAMTRR